MDQTTVLEALKAIGMYALTTVAGAVSAHYHLNTEQTGIFMTDILTVVGFAGGVALHVIAYKKVPKA